MLSRLATNRFILRAIYYPWIALPYPARRVVTMAGIWCLLRLRQIRRITSKHEITPLNKLFALSFWGVPEVELGDYKLTINGNVGNPVSLSLDDLKHLPVFERQVSLDCVGSSRNNCIMKGVSISTLLDLAKPNDEAETAIFNCADGYVTTHPIKDLLATESFMAYLINGAEVAAHGHPLRLVAPGKYGYKWAKWVTHIELVSGSPKGYWEQRGLPDRAWVGDIR